jgi:hypothetical protein
MSDYVTKSGQRFDLIQPNFSKQFQQIDLHVSALQQKNIMTFLQLDINPPNSNPPISVAVTYRSKPLIIFFSPFFLDRISIVII